MQDSISRVTEVRARRAHPALVPLLMLPSACIFASEHRPTADLDLGVASQYVFRGQVMTDRPVLQADAALGLPLRAGGVTTVRGFGNLDLTDEVGDAWFGSDHAGEFTEIDLQLSHAGRVGPLELAGGLLHYSWPEHEDFRFGPFPPTTELFARVGGELLGLAPALTVHYDFDEVESFYVLGEVGGELALADELRCVLRTWLGWSEDDHSLWLYRAEDSGFADFGGSAELYWDLDEITSLRLGVHGSTIVDDDLRQWFSGRIDPDNIWFTLGVVWAQAPW